MHQTTSFISPLVFPKRIKPKNLPPGFPDLVSTASGFFTWINTLAFLLSSVVFGATALKTLNVDSLAATGIWFTQG